MFFIFGISNEIKDLNFSKMVICKNCGKYGRIEFFMVYTYLSLFFIPVFKWGKKFYCKSTCCNAIFSVSDEIGQKILKGENPDIDDSDLIYEYTESYNNYNNYNNNFKCPNCGYPVNSEFEYCPKCGSKIK